MKNPNLPKVFHGVLADDIIDITEGTRMLWLCIPCYVPDGVGSAAACQEVENK